MTKKIVDLNEIRVSGYIMLDGAPCVIINIKKSAPGKHGHAKYRITAVGIIDGKKRVVVKAHGRVEVPIVDKKQAQVLSIKGEKAQVMDNETYETFDITIPEELKEQIREGIQISYWNIMGTLVMKKVF